MPFFYFKIIIFLLIFILGPGGMGGYYNICDIWVKEIVVRLKRGNCTIFPFASLSFNYLCSWLYGWSREKEIFIFSKNDYRCYRNVWCFLAENERGSHSLEGESSSLQLFHTNRRKQYIFFGNYLSISCETWNYTEIIGS